MMARKVGLESAQVLSEETGLSQDMGRGRRALSRPREGASILVSSSARLSGQGSTQACAHSPGPLAVGAWALVSLRVSITFKKAERALLLLEVNGPLHSFWRTGQAGGGGVGTRVTQRVWAGPSLQPASLANPEGNPEKPTFCQKRP